MISRVGVKKQRSEPISVWVCEKGLFENTVSQPLVSLGGQSYRQEVKILAPALATVFT